MKPKYTLKIERPESMKTKDPNKAEKELKDLLSVLPTLKKHGISSDLEKHVKQLRNGRKSKSFTLTLSREYNGNKISFSAPVEKHSDKIAVARGLKNKIWEEIRRIRKENRELTKFKFDDGTEEIVKIVEDYAFSQGITVPKRQDGCYINPGTFLKVMARKIRQDMLNGGTKKPSTKDNYIGIEIELAAQESREQLADAIFEAGIGRYVQIHDDGSIGRDNGEGLVTKLRETYQYTHEICILARQNEIEDVINKLCNILNNVLHVAVDKTCGLHVHLDMRNRKPDKCFNNLVLSQQFLYAMLPAQRRNSRYSKPIKGAHWRDVEDRYYGINQEAYRKYGTLEARMHCGTTNAVKINNWVKLLLAIVDSPKLEVAPTKVVAWSEMIGIDAALLTYVKSRIAKFADQHKKSVPNKEEPGTMPNVEDVRATADNTPLEQSEVA